MARDIHLQTLIHLAKEDRLEELEEYPAQMPQYHQYRDGLSVVDNVLTYNGRAVVPPHLRDTVLSPTRGTPGSDSDDGESPDHSVLVRNLGRHCGSQSGM
jgi:hypothetical protein